MMKGTASILAALLLATGCAAITNTAPITVNNGSTQKKTYAPIINSLSASPTNTTAGQPLTFDCQATDPNGQALSFTWSSTGGVISANAGKSISWTPPASASTYPVQVVVTNQDGLSTSGSLNVIVRADGNVSVGTAATSSATSSATASYSVLP